MKIFVTGGAGYVGSHCVRALCAAGHEVLVFDNLSKGHHAAVDRRASLAIGDLADRAALHRTFADHRFDAVMHFAALAEVGESVRDPLLYYQANVVNSVSLLLTMREYGVRNLVFSSSCAVYGVPPSVPITEDMPRLPISPYGRTKLAIEWAIEDCAAAWGLGATALRYFNAAGAAADGTIGEDHHPESHLIPRILQAALATDPGYGAGPTSENPSRDRQGATMSPSRDRKGATPSPSRDHQGAPPPPLPRGDSGGSPPPPLPSGDTGGSPPPPLPRGDSGGSNATSHALTIFGDDYDTPDGTCVRDYVHVDDLAAVHRVAVETQRPGVFRCYNVGTGRGHSVMEVLDAARRVTGQPIPAAVGPRRPGDPPALFADPARITRELGWRPRHTEIEDIVATAWQWHRQHPNGFDA